MSDIFRLFKKSIKKVNVKNAPRGTYERESPTFNVSIDAIVKRRNTLAEAVSESEDYNSNTTVHFRLKDAQYIKIGNYVQVDNEWKSIIEIRDGKDFSTGKTKFLYVVLGNDIIPETDEPIWGGISA